MNTLTNLNPEAFKLLYLWIHEANGRSSTLAELMALADLSIHLVLKATEDLTRHGLANVYGRLRHSPAELTPHAFNLFPLPPFDATPVTPETKLEDDTLGNVPSNVLVEVAAEGDPQNSLQKNFFSDAESLRVVVVKNSDHNQQNQPQQLGADTKNFLPDDETPWPIREICEAAAIKARRHPGLAYQKTFIAWLIYAYEHKAPTPNDPGIKAPVHFALSNLTTQPSRLYLDLAQAGPTNALDVMENWYYVRTTPATTIINQAKQNGFDTFLKTYFPDPEDAPDLEDEDDQE